MIDKLAYWNIRGLHKDVKQLEIKNLVQSMKLNFIAISETKLNLALSIKFASFLNPSWSYMHNLDQAPYGRLLVLWNPIIFHISPLIVHKQFIHSLAIHLPSNQSFHITTIYAENSKDNRQLLLDNLPSLKPSNSPWLCFGDWNCMQSSSDKSGGNPLSLRDIKPLNSAILSSELFPINETGCYYTWNNCNRSGDRTYCKLDRSYFNLEALSAWPHLIASYIPPSLSDHSPIILDWGVPSIKNHPSFSFFNSWCDHPGFMNTVLSNWNTDLLGNPMFILQAKLKNLKAALKSWSHNTFGDGNKLSNDIRNKLHDVQIRLLANRNDALLADQELRL